MSESNENDLDQKANSGPDGTSNSGKSDGAAAIPDSLNIHIPNIPLTQRKSRPKRKWRPGKQQPGRGKGAVDDAGGNSKSQQSTEPPVEKRPGQSFTAGRNIASKGLLIGVGGTGTTVVDLAIWSDHYRYKMASDRRRTFETLIPEKLQVHNFDLSQELNIKGNGNPGLEGFGAGYNDLMNFGPGAGKIPPIGRFVGELQYDYLVRQLRNVEGQVALITHSHTGGTGSGLAPTIAMLLTAGERAAEKYQLPDNINKSRNWAALYAFDRKRAFLCATAGLWPPGAQGLKNSAR